MTSYMRGAEKGAVDHGDLSDKLNAELSREGISVAAPVTEQYLEVLTPDALRFIARLSRQFSATRNALLQKRRERQAEIDAGKFPDFLSETEEVRRDNWTVAPVPADLQDRRVEITGPTDRKMVINALNSGANVYMADFEDANSPTWANMVEGQINVRDAARRTITFTNPDGRVYELKEKTATLMVRPRGWHLLEKRVLVDGAPIAGAFFDFGLCFYHNAKTFLEKGTGPYFYLPKLESHLEARLWNDIFKLAEREIGIPPGTIKATVLIETILAAFEMDEILYELREHSAGLNCGRWDYIFSYIKKFANYPDHVLPDRAQVTMDRGFLAAYVALLIKTCHRRGAHAMGGMAAQIPIKNDEEANDAALAKVRADKEREVKAGHDGTWVAHPGLVQIAREVFDAGMQGPNQIGRQRDDVRVSAGDLLAVPKGQITEGGLRANISIGVQYLEAWLRGTGCVPLYNLMEDAATAEISRSQVWQWLRHQVSLADGRKVTPDLVKRVLQEELDKIRLGNEAQYAAGRFELAGRIMEELMTSNECPEFLTLQAIDYLN